MRLSGPAPEIDGRLDDGAWAGGAEIEDFEQQRPIEGGTPTERTRLFIRYDDEALYVGARMFRADPTAISRTMTRRDGMGNAERIGVLFDTERDRRTAYGFSVTAAGVRGDFHLSQDDERRGRESQFDPVWSATARLDSLGWTAEMRIPFSQLRFPTADVQVWGFQADRWMPDKNEDLQWVSIPQRETGFISRFGTLEGIAGVKARRPVELLPYLAADATRAAIAEPLNPFQNPRGVRTGLDAKFGIGSNLTLDATINPDFGQVEADPAEVNLSAFETIQDERRPFFTEGSQLLRVEGPNYFYSRRIGTAPRGSASGDFVDRPPSSTILGAAKLTGRTSSRMSVGALVAVTAREHAEAFFVDSAATTSTIVEPQSEYAVVRLQQEIGRQASAIGASLAAVRRDLAGEPDLAAIMSREAIAGGLDWRIRWLEGRYALSGWAGFSHVAGDSLAIARIQRSSAHYFQRPDADYLDYDTARRSMSGYTASIRADKDAGRRILWGAQLQTRSPGYEVNDIGRVQSSDNIEYNADLQIRETVPGRWFQSWRLGFDTRGALNYGAEQTRRGLGQSANFTLRNFWMVNVNTRFDLPALDDGLTRGGPLMGTPLSWGNDVRLNSPFGSRTSWRANYNWNRNAFGGRSDAVGTSLTVRPTSQWQVSIDPNYQSRVDARQYVASFADPAAVATFGRRYVFATVDRTTISIRTRVNYTFSPSLTLETVAEPFVASGRFHDLGELKAPRSGDLTTYGTNGTTVSRNADGGWVIGAGGSTFTVSNRDFNVLSLRSNAVLRWEWNAGSTLYLVWQQNRRSEDVFGHGAQFDDLFRTTRAGGDNFFALKVSYWLPI